MLHFRTAAYNIHYILIILFALPTYTITMKLTLIRQVKTEPHLTLHITSPTPTVNWWQVFPH